MNIASADSQSGPAPNFVIEQNMTALPFVCRLRHADGLRKCLLLGVDRKWLVCGWNDAIDSKRASGPGGTVHLDISECRSSPSAKFQNISLA